MTFLMLNGLLIFMLFMLTSAAIAPQSKLTSGLQLDGQVHHVDIQARSRMCDDLDGRCIKEDNDCPVDMPREKVGKPYCKKGKKCCYPDDEYIVCGVRNNGICVADEGFLCEFGNAIDYRCPENYICCDWPVDTTLADAVQANVDNYGVGCCVLIPPPLCTRLNCCCSDENDITPLSDAVQVYIKDPKVICCPHIPWPACMAFNCCCFLASLVDAVQAYKDKSGLECCPFIPPPLCTKLNCCFTYQCDVTTLMKAVQGYVKDPTGCCLGVPYPLCMLMDCCCELDRHDLTRKNIAT